jgi:hypothetical protein
MLKSRAFIIGNGPSLNGYYLDYIKGQPSFACNNIHLIYPQCEWRPTHYVRVEWFPEGADINLWYRSVMLHLAGGTTCYLSGYFKDHAQEIRRFNNYHTIGNCGHNGVDPGEWHLPRLCTFGGSVLVAMQAAVNAGYENLVLLGCDLFPGHFHKDYTKGIEHWRDADDKANGILIRAHEIAHDYLGDRVINATPGGKLDMYRRANLIDLV